MSNIILTTVAAMNQQSSSSSSSSTRQSNKSCFKKIWYKLTCRSKKEITRNTDTDISGSNNTDEPLIIKPTITLDIDHTIRINPSQIAVDLNKREICIFNGNLETILSIPHCTHIVGNTGSSSSSDMIIKPSLIIIDLKHPQDPPYDAFDAMSDKIVIEAFVTKNPTAAHNVSDKIIIQPSVTITNMRKYKIYGQRDPDKNRTIAKINPSEIVVNINIGEAKKTLLIVDLRCKYIKALDSGKNIDRDNTDRIMALRF